MMLRILKEFTSEAELPCNFVASLAVNVRKEVESEADSFFTLQAAFKCALQKERFIRRNTKSDAAAYMMDIESDLN
jgi:hypothetical protein